MIIIRQDDLQIVGGLLTLVESQFNAANSSHWMPAHDGG